MTIRRGAVAAAVALALNAPGAYAQQQKPKRKIDEVVVTATKVEESLQDVPVAVSVLTDDAINNLGIENFSDYVMQLPGVTAGGSGPGQNTVYIRGVASTTPNLTVAGVAGLAPNVAFYLDEQPLAQPGRNLDVYAADLQRIEVLAGPQGTLFGASSQAGNLRLITNKPELGDMYGNVKLGVGSISGGGTNTNLEAVLNLPVSDTVALRGVFYTDTKGGYIDNVQGFRTARESARFRPEGVVRYNGVPVSAQRAGFQSTADLSGVTFLEADNSALIEDDFNEATYTGGRISVRWDITDRWSLLVSNMEQDLDVDGVFFVDPTLGGDDLEIQRFNQDSVSDKFSNTAWTIDGYFGELEAVYTGAYTDRDTDQIVDYSDYLFVGQYLPYYICDGSVTYPSGAPAGTCQAPNLDVKSKTDTKVTSHELRITTDQAKALRFTAGAFYSDLELKERNDFNYPGSINAVGFDGVTTGFAPNYPLTNTTVTGEINNASPGYYSDPGPFPDGVIFRNDVLRTDKQFGIFGEANYDISDEFAVTVGARYYDIEVDLEGSANSSFFNLGVPDDAQRAGTNISAQFAPDNTVGAPDKAATDGVIFKFTGTWRPSGDQMYYFTWSEGFRPGLLNRPGGAPGPNNFTVPYALDTDNVTNWELGLKSNFLDSTFQLNASLFYIDVQNLQTTIFDPSITNLFFSDNAADAEITGLEGDFTWLPDFSENLTLSGAFSFLDSEITSVITPTDDVRAGDELAYAPGFQGTLRARYEMDVRGTSLVAHFMPTLTYSSSQYTDIITINRIELQGWTVWGLTAGVSGERWNAELYVDNLTDERAQISGDFVFDRPRITYARPQTIGVRMGINF